MLGNTGHTSISISTGTLIRVLLIGLGAFLIWILRDLILVLLTAIVVASFVESSSPYLKRLRINKVFGIVVLYILVLGVLSGLFYLFAPLLITEIYNLSTFLSAYLPNSTFLHYFQNEAFSGAKDIVDSLSENLSIATLLATSKAFISNLSGGFFQTLSVAFGGVFNMVLIIVISFYLSIQDRGIENFLRLIFPIQYEDYVVDLWERSRRKIALWVKGQMLLALLIGVLVYLILSLLGVQYALLLALIAGIMEFIPYGAIIAAIPAISFSYLSGGIGTAAMVTGAYLIIQQFESFLLAPLVIERVVGLSPMVIILAALIGFELGGFWGLVLAIPMAVFIMELINDFEKKKSSVRTQDEKK